MAVNLGYLLRQAMCVGSKLKPWLDSLRTTVDETRIAVVELIDDHDADRAGVLAEVKTLVNDIRTVLQSDGVLSASGLAIGSTPQNVATEEVIFSVGGKLYTKAAVAAGTALSGDNVPQSKYGAWALDIGADLTIDISPASDNSTGYDSAELAAAGLPAVAASHVRLGYATAMKSDGVFDPGTTALDDAAVTEAYVDSTTLFNSIGSAVSSEISAALTAGDPTATPATIDSYEA